ncbi:MAG: hypothetical protein ACOCV1_03715 [Bacillota bacterium]
MNIVLAHIGDENFPLYIFDCISQIRRFFDGNIFVLISETIKENYKEKFYEYNCSLINLEEYSGYERIRDFSQSPMWEKGFWRFTCERLFYVEAFIEDTGLSNVIHIENDINLYENPDKLEKYLYSCYPNSIAINPVGPNHAAAAFVYIPNLHPFKEMNKKLVSHISKGDAYLKSMLNYDFVSEMVLLNYMEKQTDLIQYLPLLGNGKYSNNIKVFDSVFDCASWGQYVGGTPDGTFKPGSMFDHHWVGRELLQNKYNLFWNKDEENRNIPFIKEQESNKIYKINNLHIHCKELKKYQ